MRLATCHPDQPYDSHGMCRSCYMKSRRGTLAIAVVAVQSPHGNAKFDPKEASMRALMHRMQMTAKAKNLEWELSLNEFKKLVTSVCWWCGIPPLVPYNRNLSRNGYTQLSAPSYAQEHGEVLYNGLDRKDNQLGYVRDNVEACCKWCNFARNDRTPEEFREWIRRVHAYSLHQ